MTILVTGGCGFIGSNFINDWINGDHGPLVNIDCLSYAGQLANLKEIESNPHYQFIHANINDRHIVADALDQYTPTKIVHFAAETHVDRSISKPETFLLSNVVGTFNLLEEALKYWKNLSDEDKEQFCFIHISTDEVYGSLGFDEPSFNENSPYKPNSPYSASKAASDHFVRAYHKTYGLPCIIIHSSNVYGPRQYAEKLIPTMIQSAINHNPLPIYGKGENIRDWLFVGDACTAIRLVVQNGIVGETYNIGGGHEMSNLNMVKTLCTILEQKVNHPDIPSFESLISFIKDRPGHDLRYAIDTSKVQTELGWVPKTPIEIGLEKTVGWYLELWQESLQ